MKYVRRDIEGKVSKWLSDREIIAIRGPRQCGKTTLLMRIKDTLLKNGISESDITYISFEDDIERMKFEESPKDFVDVDMSAGKRHYFLFDEIQYVREAGKNLKLIFDTYADAKMFITGSSSLDIRKIGKYLVGRVLFFDLYPFSFREFLRSKGEKYEKMYEKVRVNISSAVIDAGESPFRKELLKFIREYLTFGSYPRVVLEDSPEKKKEILKNLFVTYIEKDILSLYGIRYRESVVKLLKAVAASVGQVTKYDSLASAADLKYHDARKLLPLLEDSFVISRVNPYHKNLISELRKNPKLYFVDCGLRNHLIGQFENLQFDHLYENFVYNELKLEFPVKYWRTTSKAEVDFVVQFVNGIVPVEVKTTPKITKSLRSFIETYKPDNAFIMNENGVGNSKVGKCKVHILPFAYI
jgi:predicted AAA+ superfamily ATPase